MIFRAVRPLNAVGLLSIMATLSLANPCAVNAAPAAAWQLVWSDEFDQPDGSTPNRSNWTYDIGGNGWGNSELESYTSRSQNARIEGGNLVIEARKETYTGPDRKTRDYTSARLKTQGLKSWTHGRLEARIQIPRGQGIWPAFWAMGNDIGSVGWPTCGEIDIMENIGKEPGTVHGTIHGPGYSGAGGISFPYSLPAGKKFADDFHVYAIEWSPGTIRWLVDNHAYAAVTTNSIPKGANWVYNHPEFILLNVAVGGGWPGNPDSTSVFPQRMLVDYVRVYAATDAATPALRIAPNASQWQARWPDLFPQAQLQYTARLNVPWSAYPWNGARVGSEFAAAIGPGFYRLEW